MPSKPKTISLRFPSMGVIRRYSHERDYAAVEYPTPWSVNTRLEDSLTNRLRGGSFTAIAAGDRPSDIRYQNRLLTFSSNAITGTRMGDDTDTALSADVSDTMRPALFQLSYGGAIGGTVVALIPHKDQTLLAFTADETWVQQGNPLTGPRRRVSDEVGIIGADAWCVNHDTVYFLSSSGLYSVGADGSGLKALSEDKVPEDLTGVTDAACTLTYYQPDRGVYIHKTGMSWFYDTERGGFWPFDIDSSDSHLLLGPLRIGDAHNNGLLQTMTGIMAASSATVTWRVVTGTTAEDACTKGKDAITAALAGSSFDEYYEAEGAWNAGRSHTVWPRVRSNWIVLWLSSAGSWAYEGTVLEVIPFGRVRL